MIDLLFILLVIFLFGLHLFILLKRIHLRWVGITASFLAFILILASFYWVGDSLKEEATGIYILFAMAVVLIGVNGGIMPFIVMLIPIAAGCFAPVLAAEVFASFISKRTKRQQNNSQ